MLNWTNRFASLGHSFYTPRLPEGLPQPHLIAYCRTVAHDMGVSEAWLLQESTLQALAGNALFQGSQPLASVYSGHQFGVWAGQLGDGRAHWLGEIQTPNGHLELQLKGAGRTPYSRMGDGRAVLRSSVREFLCSKAMHALGIPTTQALALIGSELPVMRETPETGAITCRVAPSFIRFGHFEHFSNNGQYPELRELADFVIKNYYPNCAQNANPYAALLAAIALKTAQLLAAWQAIGFCHGVMNTDNMSILGLTIDYGPFQFLDGFDPTHICNHSDTQGRYAYHRQPQVAYWNLFCLGQAFLPLIEAITQDKKQAHERTIESLETFKHQFAPAFQARMKAKLGLLQPHANDAIDTHTSALIDDIFGVLSHERTDYTLFWRTLSHAVIQKNWQPVRALFSSTGAIDRWLAHYQQALQALENQNPNHSQNIGQRMLQTNPKFILRNHLAHLAIEKAKNHDFTEIERLITVLDAPFDEHPQYADLAAPAPAWAEDLHLSCSS